jgi:hypothetical protein
MGVKTPQSYILWCTHLMEIIKLVTILGQRVHFRGKEKNFSRRASSGLTMPPMSVNPLRCFPGPVRIAWILSSLIYARQI